MSSRLAELTNCSNYYHKAKNGFARCLKKKRNISPKNTKHIKTVLSLLTLASSNIAFAAVEFDKNVDRLGIQGSTAYFSVKETFSTNCKFDVVYVSLLNEFGKSAYASLLSAQTSGRKISRMEYSQNTPGDICTLNLLETRQ